MIRYAGIPLCLDTAELISWVDQKVPIRNHLVDSSRFYPSGSPWTWIETLNMPHPQPGSLYWPSTASRWAVGYFVAHKSQVEQIVEKVFGRLTGVGEVNGADLELGFDDGIEPFIDFPTDETNLIKTEMFMLPPTPWAFTDGPDDLFLLTLVDQRYYWRWEDIRPFWKILTTCGPALKTVKWADLIVNIDQILGITLTDDDNPISDEYLEADPWTLFTGPRESKPRTLPEILDMIVWNIGRTIVVDFDGTVSMLDNDSSDEIYNDLLVSMNTGTRTRAAGWEITEIFPTSLASIIPEKILFSFPTFHPVYGLPLSINVPATSSSSLEISGTHEVVIETNGTIFGHKGKTGTVLRVEMATWHFEDTLTPVVKETNEAKLKTLAERLTRDIVFRFDNVGDFSMNSIQNFKNTGKIAITEFSYSGSRQECYTRVRTFPWNSFPEVFNHQDPNIPDPLYKSLFAVSLEEWDDPDIIIKGKTLEDGTDIEFGTEMGIPVDGFPIGTIFYLIWYQEPKDCRWVAVAAQCPTDTEDGETENP